MTQIFRRKGIRTANDCGFYFILIDRSDDFSVAGENRNTRDQIGLRSVLCYCTDQVKPCIFVTKDLTSNMFDFSALPYYYGPVRVATPLTLLMETLPPNPASEYQHCQTSRKPYHQLPTPQR